MHIFLIETSSLKYGIREFTVEHIVATSTIIIKQQQKEQTLFQVGKIIKHKILLVIQLKYVRSYRSKERKRMTQLPYGGPRRHF